MLIAAPLKLNAVVCSYTEADHHRTGIELALQASMPTSSSSSSSDDSHGPYGVDLETLAVTFADV